MQRIIQRAEVEIELLASYGDLPLPAYQTEGSAGFDFYAAVTDSVIIKGGEWKMIPTGLKFAIPGGCELQVRPRSGLAAKYGVTVLNTPGTIDSDYRGEVNIILINLGKADFTVDRGMRIAQGVLSPYLAASFTVKAKLDDTQRGAGGFGHTGV